MHKITSNKTFMSVDASEKSFVSIAFDSRYVHI